MDRVSCRNLLRSTLAVLPLLLAAAVPIVAEEPKSVRVKVMTFNILHGATTRGDFDLDRIAAVIRDEDPDLVALQEVDFKTKRAKGYDLATELGLRTKMAPLFGRAMAYDGGEYGEAILSRYSYVTTRVVPLPHGEDSEPRAALEAIVMLPGGQTIAMVATHLDHLRDDGDRIAQATKIVDVFAENALPTLLCGDLNAEPTSRTMEILLNHWSPTWGEEPAPTYPSHAPRTKIDYILVAPSDRWRVVDRRVIADEVASDHCAYVATLELVDSRQRD